MDNNLRRLGSFGRLPTKVLETDLPKMAFAITAALRGQAVVSTHSPRSASYVRIAGSTFEYLFPKWIWLRVNALILDGSFDPLTIPVCPSSGSFNGNASSLTASLEDRDPLYSRVLLSLREVFPLNAGEITP